MSDPVSQHESTAEAPLLKESGTNRISMPSQYGGVDRAVSFTETEQLTLSWHHIDVFVPSPSRGCCRGADPNIPPKHIVRDVSGICEPGTLLAILGASGAGKSTLMNVLTYRNRGNLIVHGEVRVNGKSVGRGISSLAAYVQQDDLFIGTLTVREHLTFQAQLRMDQSISKDSRGRKVLDAMNEFSLTKCADTMIGIPGRMKGISGGEMKRLSFASEILTNPPLMYCDEPTSGLDSFMAESVIKALKRMTSKNKTIICTIHQPSSAVFALFDRLLFLAEGRVAYMGPAKGAFEFFESQNLPCPPNFNPADHFIHSLAIKPGIEYECKEQVESISNAFDASVYNEQLQNSIEDMASHHNGSMDYEEAFAGLSPYKASWATQFGALFWRSGLQVLRDFLALKVRAIQTIVIALALGLIYLKTNYDEYDQKDVQNINGVLFLVLTNMTFTSMFSVINTFPLEVPIFKREHQNGMYRTDTYFLAKNLAELPGNIIIPMLFGVIMYWMCGLNSDWKVFLIAIGVCLLVANCATSFGYILSTIAKNVTTALAIGPPLLVPLMIFGGFFLNSDSVPVYLIWMQYLSWLYYGNELLIVNQWDDVKYITCGDGNQTSCIPTGKKVIEGLSFDKDNFLRDIYILVGLLIGFRIIAFIILLARSYSKA